MHLNVNSHKYKEKEQGNGGTHRGMRADPSDAGDPPAYPSSPPLHEARSSEATVAGHARGSACGRPTHPPGLQGEGEVLTPGENTQLSSRAPDVARLLLPALTVI